MSQNLLDDLGYLDKEQTKIVLGEEKTQFVYIGLVIRFSAVCIDLLFILIIATVLYLVLTNVMIFFRMVDISIYSMYYVCKGTIMFYFPIFESSKYQGSIGKILLKVKVVDKEGNRLSFGHAVARSTFKLLSSLMFCIGFLMIALTKNKQGLHDIFAETYVVDK